MSERDVGRTLIGDSVTLRPFADGDEALLFRMYKDAELARIVPQPVHASLDESRALLTRIRERNATGATIGWVIELRDGTSVGTTGLVRIDSELAKADIAYYVARDYWGSGIAHDAVATVLRFAFETLHLTRVVARVDAMNVRSQRFALRQGFVARGSFEEPFEGETRTTLVFERVARFEVRRVQPTRCGATSDGSLTRACARPVGLR